MRKIAPALQLLCQISAHIILRDIYLYNTATYRESQYTQTMRKYSSNILINLPLIYNRAKSLVAATYHNWVVFSVPNSTLM